MTPFCLSRSAFPFFVVVAVVLTAKGEEPESRPAAAEVRYEGRTIAEWIGDWDANNFSTSQKAKAALAKVGEPAVPAMIRLINERHRHAGLALQTLAKMGEGASGALPMLLELAANQQAKNPAGWTWNVSIRALLFSEAKNMGWAASQWVPVLAQVAADSAEPEIHRSRAIHALSGMGSAAEPILQKLAIDKDAAVRKSANHALAANAEAAGRSKSEVYDEIIRRNPLDANVAEYLTHMKSMVNEGRLHETTQFVKAALRRALDEKPNAQLAWTLATVIRNGLANTDLMFAAPSDSVRSQWHREDPAESYATLAEALDVGLAQAPQDSDQARRFALSLARLRLLQGDWVEMNAMLGRLGQPPVAASRRSLLPAPPSDWSKLNDDWQTADESMRGGNCAIEFRFEKDGKGLAGAHVLVKRRPKPQRTFFSGIDANTLLYATQPLEERPYDAFGYRGQDRALTRYGVSDDAGLIRIEELPEMPVVVEVLVPTGNFSEPGHDWDLVMEVAAGDIRPAWWGHNRSVSRTEGPAVISLKDGVTTHYPKFIVRPQLASETLDWAAAATDDFVLHWQRLDLPDQAVDHYEVEMMLTAPCQHPDMISQQRIIQSSTETVHDTKWEVGQRGVGGRRLRPGNLYMFEVRAHDADGVVSARLPRTRVWVPWQHRESSPPAGVDRRDGHAPFYDRIWWKTGSTSSDGTRTELREVIARYVPDNKQKFEYEYVLLGEAWLFCLDGVVPELGRKQMEDLANDLPEGNVVRETARALLKQLDAGEPLSKRFEFVTND